MAKFLFDEEDAVHGSEKAVAAPKFVTGDVELPSRVTEELADYAGLQSMAVELGSTEAPPAAEAEAQPTSSSDPLSEGVVEPPEADLQILTPGELVAANVASREDRLGSGSSVSNAKIIGGAFVGLVLLASVGYALIKKPAPAVQEPVQAAIEAPVKAMPTPVTAAAPAPAGTEPVVVHASAEVARPKPVPAKKVQEVVVKPVKPVEAPVKKAPEPTVGKPVAVATGGTIDQRYEARAKAECSKLLVSVICEQKIRFELCNGKWSPEPGPGMKICVGASNG